MENCNFFTNAAAAEAAGFRPCLLCRSEQAPRLSLAESEDPLAWRAARMLEENCNEGLTLKALAEGLNCSPGELKGRFLTEYSVTPAQYLHTCRLLLAKSLLTDTALAEGTVAKAVGFSAASRLRNSLQKHYGMEPGKLRKRASKAKDRGDVTVSLGYRPPFNWEEILAFLGPRAIKGVEAVRDGVYMRTARLVNWGGNTVHGWVKVSHNPDKNLLRVEVGKELLPVLPQVLAKVRRLFDLDCDPDKVYERIRTMNELSPRLSEAGVRVPGCFDTFEMAARAVLGQQITVKAAGVLAGRLAEAFGTPIETGVEGLTHLFPAPEDILALTGPTENHLGPLGVIAARSGTIHELARVILHREIDLDDALDPEKEMKKLTAIKGIGNWTAHYIAMRAMGYKDAFLETDVGVKKALPGYTPKELLKVSEEWRPWRSYAVMNLWNSLGAKPPEQGKV